LLRKNWIGALLFISCQSPQEISPGTTTKAAIVLAELPSTISAPPTSSPQSTPLTMPSSSVASTEPTSSTMPKPIIIKETHQFQEIDDRFCSNPFGGGGMADCPAHSFADNDCKAYVAKKYKGIKCSYKLGKPMGAGRMFQDCKITCVGATK
jgi:hypothetical protein